MMQNSGWRTWGWLGLLICLVATPLSAASASFEATGSISAIYTIQQKTLHLRFVVQVDGCRWKMRIEPEGQALELSKIQYYEDAFDGEFVYSFRRFVDSSLPSGSNTSEAVIDISQLPCESSIYAPILWLAFCSGCYLDSATESEMEDLLSGDPASRLEKRKVTYRRELNDAPPGLPREVAFFDDGILRYKDESGASKTRPRPSPFDKGFRNAFFRAEAFTNVANLSIPTTFRLEWFQPSGGAKSSNDLTSIGVWLGTVATVRPVERVLSDAFVPKTDGGALTEDRRLVRTVADGTRVFYMNTNQGGWIPLASGNLRRMHDFTREDEALSRTKTAGTKTRIKVLLVAVFLSPVLALVWILRRRWR